MKQNGLALSQADSRIRIEKRNAYHQAGHAAAIYLGNKQKQLPAVFFQLVIRQHEQDKQSLDRIVGIYGQYNVRVDGGRLIQSSPLLFTEAAHYFSLSQQEQYRCAFEADVINLLAGSLAEAKYVETLDNQTFSATYININDLHFYGGTSDLAVILDHMACFLPDKDEREQKLDELFLEAFNFVDKPTNWRAVVSIEEFFQNEAKDLIACEEVISFLESRLQV